MRLLVVDVGNTSTAVGLWDRGRVSHVRHIDGVERFEGFEMFERFERLDGVAYVSVVPKADRFYKGLFKKIGLPVHQISHLDFSYPSNLSNPSNLLLSYPRPETIGADRLADAAGAVSRYGAPVLVMDFGTALTAAVVTEDRVWRGGVIAPGFPLMRDYLFERTAKLPRMELGKGRPPKIGRSTEEAMRFGALVGYRGMVREIAAQLKRNFKTDFKLVATGGFARWALRDLELPFTIDPTLTLYGAGLIANGKLKMENGESSARRMS